MVPAAVRRPRLPVYRYCRELPLHRFCFECGGYHRDLHRVDRRQHQMCIRDRWSCVKTTEHVVTCTLAALAPGEVAPLVVYAHGHEWEDLSAVSAVVVKVADGAGAAAITESAPLNHHL